ncbi:MAG: magnesium transporter, partial [Deltaproteobacteria bacterium]|nr:magnesium transporter [Deltaproteobacteria bacterium]
MTSPPSSQRAEGFTLADLQEAWPILAADDRAEGFRLLPRPDAEEFFLRLSTHDQARLLLALPAEERRSWIRLLPPDDAADVLQHAPAEERDGLQGLLDDFTRKEVTGLLAYKEDQAGGLMNPRFARIRPGMTVDEALSYLRRQARESLGTLYYAYVVDEGQHLLGVVSFRELFAAQPDRTVRELMSSDLVKVDEHADQELVGRLFAEHDLIALPVVDAQGRMKGIVTVDDIVDVVQQEATED